MLSSATKINLGSVYTDRFFQGLDQPSWHLIYEWEDQISEAAGLPLGDTRRARRLNDNVLARAALKVPGAFPALKMLDAWLAGPSKSLYFAMSPQRKTSFSTRANVVPVVVDFWKTVDLQWFYRTYSNCPLVLISSLEAFNFLKQQDCPLNMRHFPVSLPDKYRPEPDAAYEKKYDVLIAGRPSPVLMNFVKRYEKDHPSVEYVYQSIEQGKLRYISNKTGMVGAFDNRPSYMSLLQASRVGFYSTPGMDGGEARTGGFNPVTPRLLELLAAQCHVIARYPNNDDTRFFELNDICPSVDSYDAFEETLTTALRVRPDMDRHRTYLEKHYTSARIDLLNQILSS